MKKTGAKSSFAGLLAASALTLAGIAGGESQADNHGDAQPGLYKEAAEEQILRS